MESLRDLISSVESYLLEGDSSIKKTRPIADDAMAAKTIKMGDLKMRVTNAAIEKSTPYNMRGHVVSLIAPTNPIVGMKNKSENVNMGINHAYFGPLVTGVDLPSLKYSPSSVATSFAVKPEK